MTMLLRYVLIPLCLSNFFFKHVEKIQIFFQIGVSDQIKNRFSFKNNFAFSGIINSFWILLNVASFGILFFLIQNLFF